MMKAMLTGVLAATMMLSIEPAGTLTARPMQMQNIICSSSSKICNYTQNACSYIDADNDGICDNRGSQAGYGAGGNGYGGNYTDADGDGICDNRGSQAGCGMGGGYGGSYTDADGDGICDNRGSQAGRGTGGGSGQGNGFRGGRGR